MKKFSTYHIRAILHFLFLDENYRDKFFPLLKPDHFAMDKNLHILAKAFWSMNEKYNKFPSVDDFAEEVFEQEGKNIDLHYVPLSYEAQSNLFEAFMALWELDADVKYISDITIRVLKLFAVNLVIGKYKAGLSDGSIDVDEFSEDLIESISFKEENPYPSFNALTNLEARTAERMNWDTESNVIPIPIPGMYELLEDGGTPIKTLSFCLTRSGGGKTTFLITLAKAAMLANKKVMYISAELSADQIIKKFDSCFTGVPVREIKKAAKEVRAKILASERYKEAMNRLHLIEVPMNAVSVRDVRKFVQDAKKTGFYPDLLIVDYADNLLPSRFNPNATRLELGGIYRDLRSLGQSEACSVWTASQTNDEGTKASESEDVAMSLRHANEARAKAHVADFILGIARSQKEVESNEARLIILKNRFGGYEGTAFRIYPDLECSLMWTNSSEVVEDNSDIKEDIDSYNKFLAESTPVA